MGEVGSTTADRSRLAVYAPRAGLLILALVLLWLADGRLEAYREAYRLSFEPQPLFWAMAVALAIGAGVSFGVASPYPRTPNRRRWGSSLLLSIPLLALLVFRLVLEAFPRAGRIDVPLIHPTPLTESSQVQFALAVMLGMILVSGWGRLTDGGREGAEEP